MRRTFSMLVVVLMILSIIGFSVQASEGGARIWTDKEDYGPGETVYIFGSGFKSLANVTVTVERPDGVVDKVYALTDNSGGFSCTYQLDGIAGTYTVTATDGANKATTTFTDRTWFVSVSPASATVSQGGSTTATVTVTASPTGGPEVDLWATGQPSGVTVSFSPTKGVPNFNSTMSINVGLTTTPGTYPIDIIVFTGQPGHPSYSEKARTTFTLNVTGIPPATVSITITSSPITGAGFVKVDGVAITTPATFTWTVGSTHTLEALSPVAGPTGTRYVWTSWSDGGTQTHTYIVPSNSETVTANYKTQYCLTVRTSGLGTYTTKVYHGATILGTATDAAPYTGWFEEGSLILLNVDSPIVDGSKRFVFTQWSGDAAGTSRPVSLTMNSPKDVTASYKTQYQITVTASPSGALGGTFKVTYTQCGTTYSNVQKTTPWTEWADAGTTVTVSEPQDIVNGYKFDHYDPSQSVTMTTAKTITLVYREISPLSVSISPLTAKIKIGESVTFTSSVSGGLSPYSYQWYLNGSAVSGATSFTWTFTPTATGYYIVYLKVTDGTPQTVKSNEASVTVASPLAVSISPMSASIVVGQSVAFTSTVSGGYPPYSYQWYLNDVAVSGATSNGWTFTPTSSGIYYVYLKVVDSNNNVVQSEAAKVSVASVPVGGYSISLVKQTPLSSLVAYAFVIVLSAAALGLAKRGRKFL
jgi:hypothetical protein